MCATTLFAVDQWRCGSIDVLIASSERGLTELVGCRRLVSVSHY